MAIFTRSHPKISSRVSKVRNVLEVIIITTINDNNNNNKIDNNNNNSNNKWTNFLWEIGQTKQ